MIGGTRPLAHIATRVLRRASDRHGPTFAAALSMRGFLALFALLVLAIGVFGFVAADSTTLVSDLVAELGLTGDAASVFTQAVETAEQQRVVTSIAGVVGLVWTGAGLAATLTSTWNAMWDRPGGAMRGRLVGLLWMLGAGALVAVTLTATGAVRVLPPWLAILGIALGLAADVALYLWTGWVLPDRSLGWRAMLPGAFVAAVGFGAMKALGAFVVPLLVTRSSALYGTIGVVFAILVWLLVLGRILVYAICTEYVCSEPQRVTAPDARSPTVPPGPRASTAADRAADRPD